MLKSLKGIRVVEMTIAGAGPACGRILHEFGTENILVEPYNGTVSRILQGFDYYTGGKKSIVLNTKDPDGYAALCELIKTADVFLANYRTRGLKKMGLSYEDVKKIKPDIVYATLTGFGDEGPLKEAPGNNVSAFFARGGVLGAMSQGDVLPYGTIAFGDIATGMSLALAIMSGLYHRKVTGEGCEVHSALMQCAYFLNHDPMIEYQHGGAFPKSRLYPSMALVNSYPCKDGKYIYLCLAELPQFERLLHEMGRDDLIGKWKSIADTKNEGAHEVVEILDKEFAKYTADEAVALIERADCSGQKVFMLDEVLEDPQAWANNFLYKGKDSRTGQDIIYPSLPCDVGDNAPLEYVPGPKLAADSVALLKSIGYSEEKIQSMIDRGVTRDGSQEQLKSVF